ncbi:MAG: PhzF family phenazine biosynthesis protein [Myxococcota bacterium]|nr:PhzF family phenazine biosynthesis protein [Myxococcota bacterium]
MRTLPIFQIDAFTDRAFTGNPAAVCPLPSWLPDATLQAIAAENNLSETAFTVPEAGGHRLRWFTPTLEVDLCGHATLAAASVLLKEPGSIAFFTRSGTLTVTRSGDALTMDFPAIPPTPAEPPDGLRAALGGSPSEFFRIRSVHGARYFMALMDSPKAVSSLAPDTVTIGTALGANVIATALGGQHDFVSRFFAPASGVPEDPVTGSAHCSLAPYWSGRLGRSTVTGHQISTRGGVVRCEVIGDRVLITGQCALYMEGRIHIPA